MNACLVSFFIKHLMGVDDQLLENPGATYPDVVSFRKKLGDRMTEVIVV